MSIYKNVALLIYFFSVSSNVSKFFPAFFQALKFNSDLSKWNVEKVAVMGGMLSGAKLFNQNLSEWKTDEVINFYHSK